MDQSHQGKPCCGPWVVLKSGIFHLSSVPELKGKAEAGNRQDPRDIYVLQGLHIQLLRMGLKPGNKWLSPAGVSNLPLMEEQWEAPVPQDLWELYLHKYFTKTPLLFKKQTKTPLGFMARRGTAQGRVLVWCDHSFFPGKCQVIFPQDICEN